MASSAALTSWEYWPGEPARMRPEDVDRLFQWAASVGASDITLQTDYPIYLEIDSVLRPVSRRSLDAADLEVLLTTLYRSTSAMGHLADGRYLDFPYEVALDRDVRQRFRVNATGILSQGRGGAQITARVLPVTVPLLGEVGLSEDLALKLQPRDGMVLVTGPTGSGKSTTLAALMRHRSERTGGAGKIVTYEDPIEFTHDYLRPEQVPHTLVSHSQVGRNVSSFDDAIRNALRRKPSVILVGEARDRETIENAIRAAQTGHAVYSTVHTIGAAETVRRMIAVFPEQEQSGRGYDLIDCLRAVLTQILVRRVGGGRIALREHLIVDGATRREILDLPMNAWVGRLREIVRTRNNSLAGSAEAALQAGQISRETFDYVIGTTGSAT